MSLIPILPPYQIEKKSLQEISSVDELAEGRVFFGSHSLREMVVDKQGILSVTLDNADGEEQIVAAIKKAYPEHFVYTGAYMIGTEKNNGHDLIALHSAPLSMLSFPGGKAHDVAVLASVLGHRWEQIKDIIPSTDLAELVQRLQETICPKQKALMNNALINGKKSSASPSKNKKNGSDILGIDDPAILGILKKKLGSKKIKKAEWIEHLLTYTPETISEALSREVYEETGREVVDKELAFAFLTPKGDHVMKANIVYTGELGSADLTQIKHTYTEKNVTKIEPFLGSVEDINHTATTLLANKLQLPGYTFAGEKKLQAEKLTVAVGYYIALQTYLLLKQDH